MLLVLAIAMPGRLLAISMHEAAHAWMANHCGDPTARMMGRMTLNPFKHLDPIGLLMMIFIGLGWAKPVPVNPRNFRNYRRDDILVSLAGIGTNLIMFAISCTIMYAIAGFALSRIPNLGTTYSASSITLFLRKPYYFSQALITPAFGQIAGYAYQMLMYFVLTNLVLAIFNLIPVAPLDGHHVINDLFPRARLYSSPQINQIVTIGFLFLVFFGYIATAISFVQNGIFNAAGTLFGLVFQALGIY